MKLKRRCRNCASWVRVGSYTSHEGMFFCDHDCKHQYLTIKAGKRRLLCRPERDSPGYKGPVGRVLEEKGPF